MESKAGLEDNAAGPGMMDEESLRVVGAASQDDVVAQYQAVRVRSLWKNSKRVLVLTKTAVVTVDPSNFKDTNKFPLTSLQRATLVNDESSSAAAAEGGRDGRGSGAAGALVTLEFTSDKYKLSVAYREHFLCALYEIWATVNPRLVCHGPFACERLKKNNRRQRCSLVIKTFAICEADTTGQDVARNYYLYNVSALGTDEAAQTIMFVYAGKPKVFYTRQPDQIYQAIRSQCQQVGIAARLHRIPGDAENAHATKLSKYAGTGQPVATFNVTKFSDRHARPAACIFNITESYIVEQHIASYDYRSANRLGTLFAVVRSWSDPREFTVEYMNGSSRTYHSADRDSLIASLVDVARCNGNRKVIVTNEISDSLRLLPRFAEEDYQASVTDAFFGADSIEAWYLKKLHKAFKHSGEFGDEAEAQATAAAVAAGRPPIPTQEGMRRVIRTAAEFNANVHCPGLSNQADQKDIGKALNGLMRHISALATRQYEVSNHYGLATLLQSLYRIVSSLHGFGQLVEVKDTDPADTFLSLLHYDNSFVAYWTIHVLTTLCRCAFTPRKTQQEYVNKHTFLQRALLEQLIVLMTAGTPAFLKQGGAGDEDSPTTPNAPGGAEERKQQGDGGDNSDPTAASGAGAGAGSGSSSARGSGAGAATGDDSARQRGSSNAPSPTRPNAVARGTSAHADTTNRDSEDLDSKTWGDQDPTDEAGRELVFPNSLTVSAIATLLESVVGSRRDTSSPELFEQVIEMLSENSASLVHMLRSSCPLITEHAASLMHVLMCARPFVGELMRDAALSEGLVLTHFYNAIFSPSATQRFISRFLCSVWLSGETSTPQKRLIRRMLPEGLLAFLKFDPIPESHEINLDEMEDEFYAAQSAVSGPRRRAFTRGSAGGRTTEHAGEPGASGGHLTRLRARFSIARPDKVAEAAAQKAAERVKKAKIAAQKRKEDRAKRRQRAIAAKKAAQERAAQEAAAAAKGAKRAKGAPPPPAVTAASKTANRHPAHGGGGAPPVAAAAKGRPAPAAGAAAGAKQHPHAGAAGAKGGPGGPHPAAAQQPPPEEIFDERLEMEEEEEDERTKNLPMPEPYRFENFRVMFHMITQDHNLADLLWNQRTRMELRAALERELSSLQRELKLRGPGKIAWNHQQFEVRFESLTSEVRVANMYLRYFMDAGDSFIRTIENPTPAVFFEKLLRRVLSNVERDVDMSVLCVRCIERLYRVCHEAIGSFDDMAILVHLLARSSNIEFQHCVLQLLATLCKDEDNTLQLIDADVVDTLCRFVSYTHLNQMQIGNLLQRATAKVLSLTDGHVGSADGSSANSGATAGMTAGQAAIASSWRGTKRTSGRKPSGSAASGSGGGDAGGTGRGGTGRAGGDSGRKEQEDDDEDRWGFSATEHLCPRVWYAAPPGTVPPKLAVQQGPYRTSELLQMVRREELTDEWLMCPAEPEAYEESGAAGAGQADDPRHAALDTGKWRRLHEWHQLRTLLFAQGVPQLSPSEVGEVALSLLARIVTLHRSVDTRGVPFHPVPTGKRCMSEDRPLYVLTHLMLSNDPRVVDSAATLLYRTMQHNASRCGKLYLTGAFFFALAFTGNNFDQVSRLLYETHLRQRFHDSAAAVARSMTVVEKSFLRFLLPNAVINMLVTYGYREFADVFTGDHDTPEVIWNPGLRRHLVDMVGQHLGDFPMRLQQFTDLRYQYCPIPPVHYETLERELYCDHYYLRNLVDEQRFPEWPIANPLQLLREVLEAWHAEMEKGVADTSTGEALQVLGLDENWDKDALRKAYRALARKYHPDKNPDGREMFERVQEAYELLSTVEAIKAEADMNDVILILKTQVIIYRRYGDDVKDQKYPAYKMLSECMDTSKTLDTANGHIHSDRLHDIARGLIEAGTMVMHYTCVVSPLNGRELIKQGGVLKLHQVVLLCLGLITEARGEYKEWARKAQSVARETDVPEERHDALGVNAAFAKRVIVYALKCLRLLATFEEGREAMFEVGPLLPESLFRSLYLTHIPLAVEHATGVVAHACKHEGLQQALINAGIVWKLIPFMLAYDPTLAMGDANESQRISPTQAAANMHAGLAARALGSLGGYMMEEFATPTNELAQEALTRLLTGPLARLLRNRRPISLLTSLNENCETATRIWNVPMREELLRFIMTQLEDRPPGSRPNDLEAANEFEFTQLREELCVGHVYVRVFCARPDTKDIDDPSVFAGQLLTYIRDNLPSDPEAFMDRAFEESKTMDAEGLTRTPPALLQVKHFELAVQAIQTLLRCAGYIAHDILSKGDVPLVFELLDFPTDTVIFSSVLTLTSDMAADSAFAEEVVAQNLMWRIVRIACTCDDAELLRTAWMELDTLSSHAVALQNLVSFGGMLHVLGVICGFEEYNSSFDNRLSAADAMAKAMTHPAQGQTMMVFLRKFLPEPLLKTIRSNPNMAVTHIDESAETPELIWNSDMQGELRTEVLKLLEQVGGFRAERELELPQGYRIVYKALASELYIGGVYVRLYLKNPTFELSEPIFFLEKLVQHWEHSFEEQVPERLLTSTSNSDSRSLILGNEDYLGIITSCIACVLRSRNSLAENLVTWGTTTLIVKSAHRALSRRAVGGPLMSCHRLLHVLADRVSCVDALAECSDDMMRVYHQSLAPMPAHAAYMAEGLKKIIQSTGQSNHEHAESAVRVRIPQLLLEKVITRGVDLSAVQNASALRVHAIDILKTLARHPLMGQHVQPLLDQCPSWEEYQHQSHDLFLKDADQTDYFLTDAPNRFQFLLTNGVPDDMDDLAGSNDASQRSAASSSAFGGGTSGGARSTSPRPSSTARHGANEPPPVSTTGAAPPAAQQAQQRPQQQQSTRPAAKPAAAQPAAVKPAASRPAAATTATAAAPSGGGGGGGVSGAGGTSSAGDAEARGGDGHVRRNSVKDARAMFEAKAASSQSHTPMPRPPSGGADTGGAERRSSVKDARAMFEKNAAASAAPPSAGPGSRRATTGTSTAGRARPPGRTQRTNSGQFAPLVAPISAASSTPSAVSTATGAATSSSSATAPAAPVAATRSSSGSWDRVHTTVVKGSQGLGMDLHFTNGRTRVKKLKAIENNPAANANPPVCAGDLIESVNGTTCTTFQGAVDLLRSGTEVRLVLLRKQA